MPQIPLDVVINVGGLLVSAVVLVVGLKYSLNGMRKDVANTKKAAAQQCPRPTPPRVRHDFRTTE